MPRHAAQIIIQAVVRGSVFQIADGFASGDGRAD
jgi:hypothetical protein